MFPHLISKIFLAIFILFLGWSSCVVPAQAAIKNTSNSVDTTLEAEVLQIIRQHPEVLIESVQAYQQQQQQKQQQFQEFVSSQLKTNPQTIIAESPTLGTLEHKQVLLEFSDFQCPYCAQAHKTVQQFMDLHQDQVTLVYKHFPLISIHPDAMEAAKAAWAAEKQGKFWPYHDGLFDQQQELGENLYLDLANNLNLDIEQFNRDRKGKEAEIAIQQDIELALKIGLQGTPFFVFNGQFFSGSIPLSTLEKALSL
ncbi:MAG: DsbA family protein [Crocosphaera sp.]